MKKKFSGTQIVAKLRQADILIGQGKKIPEVCKEINVSEKYLLPLVAEIWWDEPGYDQAVPSTAKGKHQTAKCYCGPGIRHSYPQRSDENWKLIGPVSRRKAVEHLCRNLGVSQRKACKALGQ